MIDNLLQQKARGELISLLYDYQYELVTNIYQTISAISFTMKQKKTQYLDRMVLNIITFRYIKIIIHTSIF